MELIVVNVKKLELFFAVALAVFAVGAGFASAHSTQTENFSQAKALMDQNVSCSQLSFTQLEEIGDYLMEQMHSGRAHELMHKMMGGEDSENVKLMHVRMARSIYCGENAGGSGVMGLMDYGMMNMMMGSGMMGSNMMESGVPGVMGYGSGFSAVIPSIPFLTAFSYQSILSALYLLFLVGLVLLVYLGAFKLWRSEKK